MHKAYLPRKSLALLALTVVLPACSSGSNTSENKPNPSNLATRTSIASPSGQSGSKASSTQGPGKGSNSSTSPGPKAAANVSPTVGKTIVPDSVSDPAIIDDARNAAINLEGLLLNDVAEGNPPSQNRLNSLAFNTKYLVAHYTTSAKTTVDTEYRGVKFCIYPRSTGGSGKTVEGSCPKN